MLGGGWACCHCGILVTGLLLPRAWIGGLLSLLYSLLPAPSSHRIPVTTKWSLEILTGGFGIAIAPPHGSGSYCSEGWLRP